MTDPSMLLVYVGRKFNAAKLGDRWWWEVLDEHGQALRDDLGLSHGVFPFGWARTEASGYRQARRAAHRVRRNQGTEAA